MKKLIANVAALCAVLGVLALSGCKSITRDNVAAILDILFPSDNSTSSSSTTEDKKWDYSFQFDTDTTGYIYYASTNTFSYTKSGTTNKNCQYQISFSNGKSFNLYTRVANGAVIESVMKGTYTGSPWANGDITLTSSSGDWSKTITISNYSKSAKTGTFKLNVAQISNEIGASTK